ncbi:MAG: 3-methyl-2-oxobutanoate hydroxymethyltransferase [Bacteriovoracaceae bacterium]|jgi:3-methyl-2-oxobutanoate hydroxymethyltransferase|nr:3-methyl-2-oxobutanoate hydroxymethyltransferase [Bacteriovoracaceae bacterium]
MKKHTTRSIRAIKGKEQNLNMLTCYDYQTAKLLDSTSLDMILVGDSVGNVILGYETTVEVTLNDMITFSSAVKRGAQNKFVIADLPFGTYATVDSGLKNAIELFQKSKVEAVKLEGAFDTNLELIKKLTQTGIPVVGHIGLTPQSVHEQGGYYTHGKNEQSAKRLIDEAKALEEAGVFCLVLECVTPAVATLITESINIPTIGIGSGIQTDGQVLVINDLLKMGSDYPPSFCTPIADLYDLKKSLISGYLDGSVSH